MFIMRKLLKYAIAGRAESRQSLLARRRSGYLSVLLFGGMVLLAGCGSSSSSGPQTSPTLSGNWQFNMTAPQDQSFLGGIQGGFLLDNSGSIHGAAVYSVSLPSQTGGVPILCNSGSAPISGTVNGQTVTLKATAATQTFTLTGTLSGDGKTISGTYASTAGTAPDGSACGTAQSGVAWSATSVPPLNGTLSGTFHSGSGILRNQDFVVTGSLTQGQNIGASSATVTGTLEFMDASGVPSNYPCFTTAFVNGQISGNAVILQIIGTDGSNVGQIGGSPGSGVSAVTFDSTPQGYILHSIAPPAYAVNTKTCRGSSLSSPGDSGTICIAMGTSNACQQPVTLTPGNLTFPLQLLGSPSTTQTVTLVNTDTSTLNGLQLNLQLDTDSQFPGSSDFNGLPNFAEQDNCSTSPGSSFSLALGQSCSITISFSPQQSCPWLPYGSPASLSGASPSACPFPVTATLTVTSPASTDNNPAFAVALKGFGMSAIQPSTPELDFGAEALSQASAPLLMSFTNDSAAPVQILGSAPCVNPSANGSNLLPHPLQASSPVGGVQVVSNDIALISPNGPTIQYRCDRDPNSSLSNFQISADTCTGALLQPQQACGVAITYAPQPNTNLNGGLDYFLELNTVQCSGGVTSDCEIDGGRFPVELKANPPSPLRMSPGAGLDFGTLPVGTASPPLTITLFNDPSDPNSATVTFVGRVVLQGDYAETDDCLPSLAPGASCSLTVTFSPKVARFDPGTITLNYTHEPTGAPQIVHLRGTGR